MRQYTRSPSSANRSAPSTPPSSPCSPRSPLSSHALRSLGTRSSSLALSILGGSRSTDTLKPAPLGQHTSAIAHSNGPITEESGTEPGPCSPIAAVSPEGDAEGWLSKGDRRRHRLQVSRPWTIPKNANNPMYFEERAIEMITAHPYLSVFADSLHPNLRELGDAKRHTDCLTCKRLSQAGGEYTDEELSNLDEKFEEGTRNLMRVMLLEDHFYTGRTGSTQGRSSSGGMLSRAQRGFAWNELESMVIDPERKKEFLVKLPMGTSKDEANKVFESLFPDDIVAQVRFADVTNARTIPNASKKEYDEHRTMTEMPSGGDSQVEEFRVKRHSRKSSLCAWLTGARGKPWA